MVVDQVCTATRNVPPAEHFLKWLCPVDELLAMVREKAESNAKVVAGGGVAATTKLNKNKRKKKKKTGVSKHGEK